MGILTNLLDTAWKEQDSRRKEEQDRFATIAQMPGIRPEIQEWAIDQLVKTAPKGQPGLKDIGGLFKGLIRGNRGQDQAQQGLQQAIQSTGRPGMQADVPAGPGALASVLPAGKAQVGPVAPSMMLSPQEQLNLKLDEFKRTESVRNDLAEQFQKFMDDRKAENQQKADTQEFDELNRRIGSFTAGGYSKQEATDMAYASMGKPAPVRGSSAVSGLVLGSDPQLQEWGKASGVAIDPSKQYHVIRDSAGKITQALEGPAAGGKAGLKGQLGEQADAEAIVAEGVGGKNKYTAAEVKAAKDVIAKFNRPPATNIAINTAKLDAQSLDFAAEQYLSTGRMPPAGMGAAGQIRTAQVLKRAAELAKERGDTGSSVVAKQAAIKAAQSSMTQMRRQYDNVTAFEKTATQNLDRAIQKAKTVIDAGSIPLNTVFRGAARQFGSGAQAAADAARQVAYTEVARVLSNPSSAAGLTDSARHEAEGILQGGYTVQQLIDVADLLKADMETRKASLQDQMKSINEDIIGGSTPKPETPVANPQARLPKPPRQGAAIGADDLQKYLSANGGDLAKTRKAVTDDGWVIPK